MTVKWLRILLASTGRGSVIGEANEDDEKYKTQAKIVILAKVSIAASEAKIIKQ